MLILLLSCNGEIMTEKTTPFPSIKDVPAGAWEKLSQKKIYFGHQSVGYNIIDGIKDLMKEYPQIKLNIIETSEPDDFKGAIFAHSKVGKNQDPASKINEFIDFMEKGIGNKADIAFFKFCYVDITEGSDLITIYEAYNRSLSFLASKFPETTFITFTIPLKTIQSGPKAWIKKLLGKPLGGIPDNIKRNKFNEMIRNSYKNKSIIFDLARIESNDADGKRSSFTKDGKVYHYLANNYTDDGGHLNNKGRKIIAEQLLIFLEKNS